MNKWKFRDVYVETYVWLYFPFLVHSFVLLGRAAEGEVTM